MECSDRVFIKSIWNCKEVSWDFIPAKGAAEVAGGRRNSSAWIEWGGGGSLSVRFKNVRGGEDWLFTGVYCRGNRTEMEILWS